MQFKVIKLEEIDSTNNFVKEKVLAKQMSANTIVVANKQTKGRGTKGRIWHSNNDHGIWATMCIANSSNSFGLVARLSVAIVKSLREYDIKAYLKWPNDIEINKKKVCGILAETCDNLIALGFGLNVNQDKKDFHKMIQNYATSMKIESNMSYEKEHLLQNILENFKNSKDEDWYSEYKKYLGILNCRMRLDNKNIIVKDVDSFGVLYINYENKKEAQKIVTGTLLW